VYDELASGRTVVQSDPIGLAGGINTYAYAAANSLHWVDRMGLEVTITCRPLSSLAALGLNWPLHCGVVVWHREEGCDGSAVVVDAQYSLPGLTDQPDSGAGPGRPTPTFRADRDAFYNPTNGNKNIHIPPPAGVTQSVFDQNVINSGLSYIQGPYRFAGPNSNTAATRIVIDAGGNVPVIPGAIGQSSNPSREPRP
jgi:uncharacterized protein RhaS with RHS repeats